MSNFDFLNFIGETYAPRLNTMKLRMKLFPKFTSKQHLAKIKFNNSWWYFLKNNAYFHANNFDLYNNIEYHKKAIKSGKTVKSYHLTAYSLKRMLQIMM